MLKLCVIVLSLFAGEQSPGDSVRVATFIQQAKLAAEKRPDSIQYYVDKAYTLANSIEKKTQKGKFLNQIGLLYKNYIAEADGAIRIFRESAKVYRSDNNYWGEGNAYNNIGLTYESLGLFSQALQCLDSALQIFMTTNDSIDSLTQE
jgi:tetratricopeptide (TPR) repeat protein